jgi:hypothetical protein
MIAWFIWKGNICRYPLYILHFSRQEGGLGLLDIKAKFHTLFINRCTQLLKRRVSLHDRMAYKLFCNVRDRQPARHECFAKRIAERLSLFPREMLLDTTDHECVRTRISEPFVYPFPIPPGEIFFLSGSWWRTSQLQGMLRGATCSTLSWTCNVLHWYKQYMISSLHKWGSKAFIWYNHRSGYTVGSGTLWNTQEYDVLCRPILSVDKNTSCAILTHTPEYIPATWLLIPVHVHWPWPKWNATEWILG